MCPLKKLFKMRGGRSSGVWREEEEELCNWDYWHCIALTREVSDLWNIANCADQSESSGLLRLIIFCGSIKIGEVTKLLVSV